MPVYEFSCNVCGKVLEKNIPFDENRSNVHCPSGHVNVQRIYTPTAVVYKGSGFYSTDHSHTSSGDVGKP